jgi:hypothetical protein
MIKMDKKDAFNLSAELKYDFKVKLRKLHNTNEDFGWYILVYEKDIATLSVINYISKKYEAEAIAVHWEHGGILRTQVL